MKKHEFLFFVGLPLVIAACSDHGVQNASKVSLSEALQGSVTKTAQEIKAEVEVLSCEVSLHRKSLAENREGSLIENIQESKEFTPGSNLSPASQYFTKIYKDGTFDHAGAHELAKLNFKLEEFEVLAVIWRDADFEKLPKAIENLNSPIHTKDSVELSIRDLKTGNVSNMMYGEFGLQDIQNLNYVRNNPQSEDELEVSVNCDRNSR